ncbi:hypothetical protein NQL31_000124 [Lotmaria passim]
MMQTSSSPDAASAAASPSGGPDSAPLLLDSPAPRHPRLQAECTDRSSAAAATRHRGHASLNQSGSEDRRASAAEDTTHALASAGNTHHITRHTSEREDSEKEKEGEEEEDGEIIDELDLYCQMSSLYLASPSAAPVAAASPEYATTDAAGPTISTHDKASRFSSSFASSGSVRSSNGRHPTEREKKVTHLVRRSSHKQQQQQQLREETASSGGDGQPSGCSATSPYIQVVSKLPVEDGRVDDDEAVEGEKSMRAREHQQQPLQQQSQEEEGDADLARPAHATSPNCLPCVRAKRSERHIQQHLSSSRCERSSSNSSSSRRSSNPIESCEENAQAAQSSQRDEAPQPAQPPVKRDGKHRINAINSSGKSEAEAASSYAEGPYMPPLMPEFDGELLQIIKNYYLRKHAASASASAAPLSWQQQQQQQQQPQQRSQLMPGYTSPVTFAPDYAGSALDRMNHLRTHANNAHIVDNHQLGSVPASLPFSTGAPTLPLAANVNPVHQPDTYLRSPSLYPQSSPNLAAQTSAEPRLPIPFSSPPFHTTPNAASGGGTRDSSRGPNNNNNNNSANSATGVMSATSFFHRRLPSIGGGVAAFGAPSFFTLGGAPPGVEGWQNDERAAGPHSSSATTTTSTAVPLHASAVTATPHSSPFSSSLVDGVRQRVSGHPHHASHARPNESGSVFPYSPAAAAAAAAAPAASGSGLSGGLASGLSALSSLPSYSSTSFVRAYVSDISLSLEPAIIVSALTAALNIVVVAFLQHHVLDTRDHLGLFLIGSYMIFASYYMVYYFLERFSGSFRRIASQDKKFYIIGNLIKAGILISITPFACVHLVKIIVFDEWESNILRNLGCIYAIPDLISMVVVRRMRWSTWIHHACVVVFNYFSIMNNYQHENVCRCVVVYAAFSSFAYCVNVLLASRFLGVSVNVARVLSFVALVVYALCCAVNWAWQVYYLRRLLTSGHDHWTVYMYMFLISLVMWDDIVLNKWLLHHARNNAYAASQHLQQHRFRQQQQQQQQPSPLFTAQSRPAALFRSQEERQMPIPQARPPSRAH